MRRLLVPVAVLAAVLLAPSVALAAIPPTLTLVGPAARNTLPSFTWDDVQVLPVTYRVYRANGACATAGNGVAVSGSIPASDPHAFTETDPLADSVYCYHLT